MREREREHTHWFSSKHVVILMITGKRTANSTLFNHLHSLHLIFVNMYLGMWALGPPCLLV